MELPSTYVCVENSSCPGSWKCYCSKTCRTDSINSTVLLCLIERGKFKKYICNSMKQRFVGSFIMGWRIFVFYPEQKRRIKFSNILLTNVKTHNKLCLRWIILVLKNNIILFKSANTIEHLEERQFTYLSQVPHNLWHNWLVILLPSQIQQSIHEWKNC